MISTVVIITGNGSATNRFIYHFFFHHWDVQSLQSRKIPYNVLSRNLLAKTVIFLCYFFLLCKIFQLLTDFIPRPLMAVLVVFLVLKMILYSVNVYWYFTLSKAIADWLYAIQGNILCLSEESKLLINLVE